MGAAEDAGEGGEGALADRTCELHLADRGKPGVEVLAVELGVDALVEAHEARGAAGVLTEDVGGFRRQTLVGGLGDRPGPLVDGAQLRFDLRLAGVADAEHLGQAVRGLGQLGTEGGPAALTEHPEVVPLLLPALHAAELRERLVGLGGLRVAVLGGRQAGRQVVLGGLGFELGGPAAHLGALLGGRFARSHRGDVLGEHPRLDLVDEVGGLLGLLPQPLDLPAQRLPLGPLEDALGAFQEPRLAVCGQARQFALEAVQRVLGVLDAGLDVEPLQAPV